ncbi:response regulator [Paludisphaera mucosa]|uniref:Response regulator n=1 Tax=Paludisphaera mucosa TaxID=3030827 RepID=A0ABT6F3X9_9BACT|nr:response regulator [Paludisphaera mucosa]MDG3002201.1 response regulator [Paludisphaera mucosa]
MKTQSTDRATPGRCVLIIDDNEDLALSQASLLQYYGCRVEVAHDGWEGLRLAIQKPHDVVFIDIGLPGMSGYEVVRAIRSALSDPPILLAQTAYGQPEDMRKSREAGFDAHLVKPVDPSEIVRHVLDGREALRRSGSGSGDESPPTPLPPRIFRPGSSPGSAPADARSFR